MTKREHSNHDRHEDHAKSDEKYTRPELREKIKAEIRDGDKGGKPGQWSARKSQLLVHEYEKRGGGYTTEKRDDDQKHLEQWGEEEWTTADGKPADRDGEMHRYLPKEAWDRMSPKERKEADAKKVKSGNGETQYVANTEPAKEARRVVSQEHRQD